jgi:hypothetical protein
MLGRKKRAYQQRAYHLRAAVAEVLERRLLLSNTITAVEGQNFDVGDLDGTNADVVVPAGVSVSANQVRVNQLTVDGYLAINPNPNGILDPTGASMVNSITIGTNAEGAFTGTLDLGNNVLIINEPSEDAALDEYNIIWSAIQSGFNSGWTGPGIISSLAANDQTGQTSIGVAIVNQLFGGETVEWSGQTVGSDDIIVAVTDAGDASLNGVVDLNDFDQFLYGYTTPGATGWANGDFDYNGVIDLNDADIFVDSYTTAQLPVSTVPQGTITSPQYAGTVTDTAATGPSDVEANINWGDGTSATSGAIETDALGDTTYNIVGDHTYAVGGTYNVITSLTDQTNSTKIADARANVLGLSVSGESEDAVAGDDFTGPVATFTDTSANASGATYTATVNWNDGNGPQAATVLPAVNGVYTVEASKTFSDSGLDQGTVDITGSDGMSGQITTNIDVDIAPPGLSGVVNSSNEITLTMTSPANNARMELEEMGPGDLNFKVLTDYDHTQTQEGQIFILPLYSLAPDSEYQFRERADLDGEEAYSGTVDLTTTTADPAAPQGLSVTPDEAESEEADPSGNTPAWDISWSGPATIYVDYQMSLGNNLWYDESQGQGLFPITGQSNGEGGYTALLGQYSGDLGAGIQYRAIAYTDAQGDHPSSYAPFSYQGSGGVPPSGLTVYNNGNGTADFDWTYEGDGGVTLYEGAYIPGSQVVNYDGGNSPTDAEGDEADGVPIPSGVKYVFFAQQVQSYDGSPAISQPSGPVFVNVPSVPAVPGNLGVYNLNAEGTEQALIWDNDPDNESGFSIYAEHENNTAAGWQLIASTPADVTRWVNEHADPNDPLVYSVVAFNSAGNSSNDPNGPGNNNNNNNRNL